MISGLLLLRGYDFSSCKCIFPGAFLLIKITCPFLFRIILPRSNRMNTSSGFWTSLSWHPQTFSSHVPARVNIKVQSKSEEKTVNRYLFIGIIFISQKLTICQHYLDACLLLRCWLKAVSTISRRLAVLELLANSSSGHKDGGYWDAVLLEDHRIVAEQKNVSHFLIVLSRSSTLLLE